jgi:hypothetical protein
VELAETQTQISPDDVVRIRGGSKIQGVRDPCGRTRGAIQQRRNMQESAPVIQRARRGQSNRSKTVVQGFAVDAHRRCPVRNSDGSTRVPEAAAHEGCCRRSQLTNERRCGFLEARFAANPLESPAEEARPVIDTSEDDPARARADNVDGEVRSCRREHRI